MMSKIPRFFLVLMIAGLFNSVGIAGGPKAVAHRGLLQHAPENTLANFRACLELRVGFEFDVEKTEDGQLVCIHDDSVDRTTDGTGKLSEMSLNDVRKLDAGSWFDPAFAGEKVPTVDEVLQLVAENGQHDVLIAVDLKAEDTEREVVRLATKHKVLHRLLFIGRTISDKRVRQQLREASSLAQCAVVANSAAEFPDALQDDSAQWVYFRFLPSEEQVAAVHAAGRQAFIAGATVSGMVPDNWQQATEAGIDGILTDYPLELRQMHLQKRPPAKSARSVGFDCITTNDRLHIFLNGQPIVDFVFRDDKILRPYFANARLTDGQQITRQHPPVAGIDATDHDTMHPGIWLAFGDLSQQDFWRNKAAMEHVRFVTRPAIEDDRLGFATESLLKTSGGDPLCRMIHNLQLVRRPAGWMLVWVATIDTEKHAVVFGDQEEMGFGARVATPLTELNGGLLKNSAGNTTARATWGQPASWCDYSGTSAESGGIMLMASRTNFRESWWHNRDYGVFVANPFGREAMKQGERSTVTVPPGHRMRLMFGALIHDHRTVDHDLEFATFEQMSAADVPSPIQR